MAISAAANRRRGAVYGRKTSRLNGFNAVSFEEYLTHTPTKQKSTLSRIQSPAKASGQTKRFDEQLFDVPSSDNEGDDTRIDSILKPLAAKADKHAKICSPRTPKSSSSTAKSQTSEPPFHGKTRKRPGDTLEGRSARPDDPQNLRHKATNAGTSKRLRFSTLSDSLQHATGEDSQAIRSRTGNRGKNRQIVSEAIVADDTQEMQLDDEPIVGDEDIVEESSALPTGIASTPPQRPSSNTSLNHQRNATATPRQRQLWKNLLDDRDFTPVREIQQLQIAPQSKLASAVARPASGRERMIDTLRPSLDPTDRLQSSDVDDDDSLAEGRDSAALILERLDSSATNDKPELSMPVNVPSKAAPKRTYGQQRSYLSEPSQNIDELLTQPLDFGLSPAVSKPSKSKQNQALSKSEFDFDEEDEDNGKMQSIHELRVGGDSRRFDDQMSTILDDIKDRSKARLSVRRATLISLAENLCDPNFKARFVDSSYAFNVFRSVVEEEDPICGVACAAAIIAILKSPADPRSSIQVHDTGFTPTLARLLLQEQDVRKISKDRQINMSRVAQNSVTKFVETMMLCSLLDTPRPAIFSPRLISLTAIEMLLRRSRETGSVDNILHPTAFSNILTIATQSSKSAFDGSGNTEMQCDALSLLKTSLSALESLTVAHQSSANGIETWSNDQFTQIADISCTVLATQVEDNIDLRCLVLRLLLNISNGNEANSNKFANIELLGYVIRRIVYNFRHLSQLVINEASAAEFDDLVLSLGTLFNVAEMSFEVRRVVARSYASIVEDLVRLFNEQREKVGEAASLAESQANVAFGYLAVLLGILCEDATGLQRIRAKLPKQDLGILINAVEEFTTHHQMVDGEGSNEVWKSFTSRLQSVAEALKQINAR